MEFPNSNMVRDGVISSQDNRLIPGHGLRPGESWEFPKHIYDYGVVLNKPGNYTLVASAVFYNKQEKFETNVYSLVSGKS